jgi:hypothetical protein
MAYTVVHWGQVCFRFTNPKMVYWGPVSQFD